MAGFLDSKERVVDLMLTGAGRSLLSKGDLRFVYWTPFDDEVDYDPFITESGSLSDSELSDLKQTKTEDPLVREACFGYPVNNRASADTTNVNRPVFTVPPGQKNLPRAILASGSLEISMDQRPQMKLLVQRDHNGKIVEQIGPHPAGVVRSNSSEEVIPVHYSPDSYPSEYPLEGFLVTVYQSSSDGYVEVLHNRDTNGNLVYNNDLKVEIEKK